MTITLKDLEKRFNESDKLFGPERYIEMEYVRQQLLKLAEAIETQQIVLLANLVNQRNKK